MEKNNQPKQVSGRNGEIRKPTHTASEDEARLPKEEGKGGFGFNSITYKETGPAV